MKGPSDLSRKGFSDQEKYSRGWRGAPAKGVGRESGARVQIPLSPFYGDKNPRKNIFKKKMKIKLDRNNEERYDVKVRSWELCFQREDEIRQADSQSTFKIEYMTT